MTHDEDRDGVGDACDICPATADPRQLDTTERATMLAFADGVGDACDPRPNLTGDKLAALHPFVDASELALWDGAGWTIGNDRAVATTAARFIAKKSALGDGVFVQARFAVAPLEVILDGNGVDAGLTCALAVGGDGMHEIIAREIGGATMSKTTGKLIAGAVALTAWRVIDVNGKGTLHCRATYEGGMTALDLVASDAFAVGLYGFATTTGASVDSIVVYTSPTLPPGNVAVNVSVNVSVR